MKIALYGKKSARLEELLDQYGIKVVSVDDPEALILCYGGDGAMLGAELRYPARLKIPVRDCETAPHCSAHGLEDLVRLLNEEEEYKISTLMKLSGECGSFRCNALNDIFIHGVNRTSALRFQLQINGQLYAREIVGDAVGVSTVHGSTAYYRSITHGSFQVGIGLAFSNTTELVNHLVLPETSEIKIRILRGPAELVYDNSPETLSLKDGAVVRISRSQEEAHMIFLDQFMCPECRRIRHEERSHGYEDIPL